MATMLPSAPPIAPAVMRILGRYDRAALSSFISVAIDLLDVLDGDADIEPNGDELDGNMDEDDFIDHGPNGPGCPLADPDMAVDDDRCDEPTQDLEPDEGGRVMAYGLDQTRPISADNPMLEEASV